MIVAISNQKGGVGKTTTVINCAAYAALTGRKTLVVDNDPQGNASSVLVNKGIHGCVYGSGAEAKPLETTVKNLWVIPGGADLLDAERRLALQSQGQFALRTILSPLRQSFDLILIDCPPSLSLLPSNGLLAADALLLPLQCEYFALEGLTQLLAYVEDLRESVDAQIALVGVLLTMFDREKALSREIEREVRHHFGPLAFQSMIPSDLALAAAPSHGQSIAAYDPLSPGGIAYLAATKELLDGLKRLQPGA